MATLNFKGKSFVQNHHLAVKYHQLIPKKDKSLTDKLSLNDNLIIHGDNLIALKALLPTYAGKIKCIYIDPPYNTGNEKWVYNDNVNSPMMQEWLGKVVDKEDFTRHDKWLCMMMPRLKLLRELLRDDGVIFVSIDDNEVHHLRMLMDEVFGESNFLAELGWQKKFSRQSDAKYFSDTFELILVYSRNISNFKLNLLPRTTKQDERYKNPDNDPRGYWSPDNMVVKTYSLVECEDYADKITAERVRRVIKGVKKNPPQSPFAKGGLKNIPPLEKGGKGGFEGLGGTLSYFELGEPIEMENILEGKKLPDYMELARYICYTATGEEFNPSKVKQSKNFIGETKDYEVYLFYEPDIEKLKKLALTLDTAKKLGAYKGKKRLVFAPTKYLDLNDADLIEKHGLKGIEYCQLPFEIYKVRG